MTENKTLKFLVTVLGMLGVLLTWPVVADEKTRNSWVFQSSGTPQPTSGSGSTQTPQEKKVNISHSTLLGLG